MDLFLKLAIILFFITIANHFCNRFNLPSVIGQLLVGVVIGPAIFNIITYDHFITFFSEIGVVLLLFIAGLESDITQLKKYLRPSLAVAVLGVVIPFMATFLLGYLWHFNIVATLFISIIFSATSVSISVEVLKNMNMLAKPVGATILGAAVVDDILAIIILSLATNLVRYPLSFNQLNLLLLLTIKQVFFFIIIILSTKYLIPKLLQLADNLLFPFSEIIVSLIICFTIAAFAEAVGLSAVIGAFFAGIIISKTQGRKNITHNISIIGYTSFIPIFFISIGLNMQLKGLLNDLMLLICLVLVGVLSKLLGAGLGAKLMQFSTDDALIIGAGMIARGEMALVIAQIVSNANLISNTIYSTVIAAIIIITLIAPFILKFKLTT